MTITLSTLTFNTLLILIISLVILITLRKIEERVQLKQKYERSLACLGFLLTVEEIHCQNNKEILGQSFKTTRRREASLMQHLQWDKEFSKGYVLQELKQLQENKEPSSSLFLLSLIYNKFIK